jgi:hypothetical protein
MKRSTVLARHELEARCALVLLAVFCAKPHGTGAKGGLKNKRLACG